MARKTYLWVTDTGLKGLGSSHFQEWRFLHGIFGQPNWIECLAHSHGTLGTSKLLRITENYFKEVEPISDSGWYYDFNTGYQNITYRPHNIPLKEYGVTSSRQPHQKMPSRITWTEEPSVRVQGDFRKALYFIVHIVLHLKKNGDNSIRTLEPGLCFTTVLDFKEIFPRLTS